VSYDKFRSDVPLKHLDIPDRDHRPDHNIATVAMVRKLFTTSTTGLLDGHIRPLEQPAATT
jgi:hypothetical protein